MENLAGTHHWQTGIPVLTWENCRIDANLRSPEARGWRGWRAGEAKRARVRTPYRVRGARRSVTGVEGESDRSPRGQSGELEGTESDSVPRFLTVYAYVWGAKPNGRQRGRGATDDPDLGGYTTHHTAGTRRSRRRVEHIVASPGHPRLPAPRVAKSIVSRHLFVGTAPQARCAVGVLVVTLGARHAVHASFSPRSIVRTTRSTNPSRSRIDRDVIGAVRAACARPPRPHRARFSNFFKFAPTNKTCKIIIPAQTPDRSVIHDPTGEPERHGGCQGKQGRRR